MNAKKNTMKKKPTLRDAQKAHTRQRFLDAARDVFYREGYYGATVDQIVAEAGASRPTFYLHFKDKEEVLGELLLIYRARALPYLERLPGPRPTVDELKEWLEEMGRFIQQEIALYSVLGEVSTHRQASSRQPHQGLAAIDAWIEVLSHRAPAFAAATRKADINARARADLLILDIVWAAGNVVRDKGSAFTEETLALVAKSLGEFLNDPRFHAKSVVPKKVTKSPKKTRTTARAG
jgi:AcrR family transcriptional regulator